MSRLTITPVVVITLTATFLLLAFDRAGALRQNQAAYVPPSKPVAAVAVAATPGSDKGKPLPHGDYGPTVWETWKPDSAVFRGDASAASCKSHG